MYIKKIPGTKCYLSPMSVEDAEQFTVWLNDLEVINYLTLSSAVVSVDSEKEALQSLQKNHNYSIIDAETNELIGSVGFNEINSINQSAEIGIFMVTNLTGAKAMEKKRSLYSSILDISDSTCTTSISPHTHSTSAPLLVTKALASKSSVKNVKLLYAIETITM